MNFIRMLASLYTLPGIDQCFSEEKFGMSFVSCRGSKPRAQTDLRGSSTTACPIIKRYIHILQAFNSFWALDYRIYLINQAYMILLHKKKDVTEVKDYLSISLIHSFSKLVAKVLSA
jgi:hypothetical protein